MPEWHLGDTPALQVYNTQSRFSKTAELGGSLFIIGGRGRGVGDIHLTSLSLLSNKWNLVLYVSWTSSGCPFWKLTPCTASEKGLGRLSGCVAEFSVRDRARQWDQSWPGVLFQAGDLYSVHLFVLLFVLLSGCDPGFLLLSSGKKIEWHPERVWPLPQMQCPSLDQSTVSRGWVARSHQTSATTLWMQVTEIQFLERHYVTSRSPDSPHKWITSSVASATFAFWQGSL